MFVSAVLLGYLVFSELPDMATLVGALIVIASGLYSFIREQRMAQKQVTRP
jgi:drug/metabolite transporter (DMT)-like permease